MDDQFERRTYTVEGLEVRQLDDGPEIVGYAAVFNQRSVDLGGFVEKVVPGAFRETLAASPDVRATVDHRGGLLLLGRTRNGTLTLREDERGLRVRIRPPETSAAQDILTLLRRGDMDQMSFMFRVQEDEWRKEGNLALRRLHKVDLDDGDVSVVTYAAYPQTSVSARARAMVEEFNQQDPPGDGAEGGPAPGNELADVESEVRSTNLRVRLEIAKRKLKQ